jgi:hypothetical protein
VARSLTQRDVKNLGTVAAAEAAAELGIHYKTFLRRIDRERFVYPLRTSSTTVVDIDLLYTGDSEPGPRKGAWRVVRASLDDALGRRK